MTAIAEITRRRLELFPDTTEIAEAAGGECLTIAGCDLPGLADRYGTPLYLYDRVTLEAMVSAYRAALSAYYPGSSGITYAGKAFMCTALAQWADRNGLWGDFTGVGELKIAETARMSRNRILVHGVNKSAADLAAAVDQAGTLVVDNLLELERLIALWRRPPPRFPDLWLRLRPGLAVDTHVHTQTGQEESKFGMGVDEVHQAVALCRQHNLPLKGLHFHQGSHFHDPAPLRYALDKVLDLMVAVQAPPNWTVCPGGGWGLAYHEDDLPQPDIEEYVRTIATSLTTGCQARGLPLPHLQLEPGRSLVARAGVALYRVGTVKQSANRRWVLLDGGLTDNPRPALYGARYSALPVRHPQRQPTGAAWLAGPYCESGDVLIENLPLPRVEPGELMAIPASGAYQLSMSSNYNGACRPAVLWLEEGRAFPIQTRETPEDLARRDRRLWPVEARSTDATPMRRPGIWGEGVRFAKYHGLGNDYLVLEASDLVEGLTPTQIRRICAPHYGIGSDGLLVGSFQDPQNGFSVRCFNPDGSEFEKTGNGLRIFARYLWDEGWVRGDPFTIQTLGGQVRARVHPGGRRVTVEMGTVSFDSRLIPVAGPPREVLDETLSIEGQSLRYCAATVGNPHCVVLCDEVSAEMAQRWGPQIENDARFPNRTNVQFMRVLDRANIQIEIWERGAGYTLASGSSSCAAAAVAHRLGWCDSQISVHQPGGRIQISLSDAMETAMTGPVSMTGSVSKVCEGVLSAGMLDEAGQMANTG